MSAVLIQFPPRSQLNVRSKQIALLIHFFPKFPTHTTMLASPTLSLSLFVFSFSYRLASQTVFPEKKEESGSLAVAEVTLYWHPELCTSWGRQSEGKELSVAAGRGSRLSRYRRALCLFTRRADCLLPASALQLTGKQAISRVYW